jgi:rfaE bifunctional protein nucleotidyltransferase chain/domain
MVTPPPSSKILDRPALIAHVAARRAAAPTRVVLTNGIFDLMHVGHLRYLVAARALGDLLVVGVNADASTHRLKGPTRPIVPEAERAEMLAGLACVDLVTIFPEDTAEDLVDAIQPDIYTKGGDYTLAPTAADPPAYTGTSGTTTPSAPGAAKPLPEAAHVARYGGRVVLVPYVPGHSTTELISRIVAGSQDNINGIHPTAPAGG